MKKRIKFILPVLVLVLVSAFILVGCMSDEEKAAVGRYNISTVSAAGETIELSSLYDHFYIELKDNKDYVMSYKVAGISGTTSMEGTWAIKDSDVVFTTRQGAAKSVEEFPITATTITMTMSYGGETMTMVFVKQAADKAD